MITIEQHRLTPEQVEFLAGLVSDHIRVGACALPQHIYDLGEVLNERIHGGKGIEQRILVQYVEGRES